MNYEKMWNELKTSLDNATHDVPPSIHPTVKKTAIQVFQNVISKMNNMERKSFYEKD